MQNSGEGSKGTQTLLLTELPLQEMKGRTKNMKLKSRTRRGLVKARVGQPCLGISIHVGHRALEEHLPRDLQSWLNRMARVEPGYI